MEMRIKYIIIFFLILSIKASSQYWKIYPYQQQGSIISFPEDEGFHPGESIEWWYINGQVTGQVTGDEYTFMLSYFYEPAYGFDGFRIFNLSNETTKEFCCETLPCLYGSVAEDSLNIIATVGFPSTHYEEWVTQTDVNGTMKPFQYHLNAVSGNGSIDINCSTLKRPLIIADSGLLFQGASGYTYYYSQTMMDISGTISFNSTTENISGTGWLDRQYGSFNPNDSEEYEWFCIQLSNGMDLNVWNIFTDMNDIPDTSTYRICSVYINDSSSFTTSEFNIERQKFAYSQDNAKCYSQQWRLLMDTFDIDLIVNTQNSDNEVVLPFRFFEGSTIVQGTVQGLNVDGKGFTELLHSYEKPDLTIVYPDSNDTWDDSKEITWKLNNPDQGNSLKYDIDISTDNKNTFRKIARTISDTSYYWNPSYFIEDTVAWLRITGYSFDSTLIETVENEVEVKTQQKNYELCTGDSILFVVLLSEEENFSYQWQKNDEDISGATDSIYFSDSLTTEDNGSYKCIIYDDLLRDTTISYNLEIHPVFDTNVFISICDNDSIYISGEWKKTDGIYIEELISVNGCDSINTINLSVESCGLSTNNVLNDFLKIFTNPVTRSVHIKFENCFTGYIEMLNLNGEILKIRQIQNSKEAVLNIYDLDIGIYFLRFRSKSINGTKKIML